jgi:protein translocase SecG subunit
MEYVKLSQVILALLLTVAVLMQNRGGGLSNIFGGGGANVFMTKRGLEKKLFIATIILSVLFFSVSLLSVILQS